MRTRIVALAEAPPAMGSIRSLNRECAASRSLDVRSWPFAIVRHVPHHVGYRGEIGHRSERAAGPLMTQLGHWPTARVAVAKLLLPTLAALAFSADRSMVGYYCRGRAAATASYWQALPREACTQEWGQMS